MQAMTGPAPGAEQSLNPTSIKTETSDFLIKSIILLLIFQSK